MSFVNINASGLSTILSNLLATNEDIQPGTQPSYQLCKEVYLHHPLGAKIVDKPIQMAMSQEREISVPDSPEERVKEQFTKQWKKDGCKRHIRNTMRLARIYGISACAMLVEGVPTNVPIDFTKIWNQEIAFNTYDPLNTAGSLVLNQNPLAMDFQHVKDIAVQGKVFHRSRTCVVTNEQPIYLSYTTSGYGFVGRSAFQRVLYPLKTFLQTMVTDDLVSVKAGVLVAKVAQPGSVVSGAMTFLQGLKRNVVREAKVGNVISISAGDGEEIESIDLTNLAEPFKIARENCIQNIASGVPMPAKLLTEESYAEGFGEGEEDAKQVARFIDLVREDMDPLVDYFEKITRYRAWNPDFYKTIQRDFPDYKDTTFEEAFYQWSNSFVATWPNYIKEPDSELVKVDDVKLRAMIAIMEVLVPQLGPINKAEIITWFCDSINGMKLLFGEAPLMLDANEIETYEPPEQAEEPPPNKPMSRQDAVTLLKGSVARLLGDHEKRRKLAA